MSVRSPGNSNYTITVSDATPNKCHIKKANREICDVAIHVLPTKASFFDKAKAFFLSLFSWKYVKIAKTDVLINIASIVKCAGLSPAKVRELAQRGEGILAKGIVDARTEIDIKTCQNILRTGSTQGLSNLSHDAIKAAFFSIITEIPQKNLPEVVQWMLNHRIARGEELYQGTKDVFISSQNRQQQYQRFLDTVAAIDAPRQRYLAKSYALLTQPEERAYFWKLLTPQQFVEVCDEKDLTAFINNDREIAHRFFSDIIECTLTAKNVVALHLFVRAYDERYNTRESRQGIIIFLLKYIVPTYDLKEGLRIVCTLCQQLMKRGDDDGLEDVFQRIVLRSHDIESLKIPCSPELQLKLALFEGDKNRIQSLHFTRSDAEKALKFISRSHSSPSVPCTSAFMARCRTQFGMNIRAHIDQLVDGNRKTVLTISLINSIEDDTSRRSAACDFYNTLRRKNRREDIETLFASRIISPYELASYFADNNPRHLDAFIQYDDKRSLDLFSHIAEKKITNNAFINTFLFRFFQSTTVPADSLLRQHIFPNGFSHDESAFLLQIKLAAGVLRRLSPGQRRDLAVELADYVIALKSDAVRSQFMQYFQEYADLVTPNEQLRIEKIFSKNSFQYIYDNTEKFQKKGCLPLTSQDVDAVRNRITADWKNISKAARNLRPGMATKRKYTATPQRKMNVTIMKLENGDVDFIISGKKLGEGGFKKVKVGFSLVQQEAVARGYILKQLRNDNQDEIVHELRVSKMLKEGNVKNVVILKEIRHDDTNRGILSPLYNQGNAADFLNTIQPYRTTTLTILRDAARGIAGMHGIGLLHLDIKPENILVDQRNDGTFVADITDYGLVRDDQSVFKGASGTPGLYDPRMREKNIRTYDKQMDVFSFGVTICQMVLPGQQLLPDHPSPEDARQLYEWLRTHSDPAVRLAAWCINPNVTSRPTMDTVYERLRALVNM